LNPPFLLGELMKQVLNVGIFLLLVSICILAFMYDRYAVLEYKKLNLPSLPPIILPAGSEIVSIEDDFMVYIDPFGKTRAIMFESRTMFKGE